MASPSICLCVIQLQCLNLHPDPECLDWIPSREENETPQRHSVSIPTPLSTTIPLHLLFSPCLVSFTSKLSLKTSLWRYDVHRDVFIGGELKSAAIQKLGEFQELRNRFDHQIYLAIFFDTVIFFLPDALSILI